MPDLIDAKGEFFTKTATAAEFFEIDWTLDLGADTISGTPTWSIPVGITDSNRTNTTTTTRLKLSGGTAGTEYAVTCTVSTAGGQTLGPRTLWIRITPFPTLAANALIDLDYLKTYMRVYEASPESSIDNVLLAQKIAEASDLIEFLCRRTFKTTDYVERFQWDRSVSLKNYPIHYVKSIHRATRNGLKITNTATKDYATVWVSGNRKLYLSVSGGASHGLQSVDLTLSANDTLGELVTVIPALGSGWGCALATGRSGNERSEDLVEFSAQMVESGGLYLAILDIPETCGFSIDEPSGVLLDLSTPYAVYDYRYHGSPAWAKYRAGYDAIPDDLKSVAAAVSKHLFDEASREAGLQSEHIGDYSYTRFTGDTGNSAPNTSLPSSLLAAISQFASPRL